MEEDEEWMLKLLEEQNKIPDVSCYCQAIQASRVPENYTFNRFISFNPLGRGEEEERGGGEEAEVDGRALHDSGIAEEYCYRQAMQLLESQRIILLIDLFN